MLAKNKRNIKINGINQKVQDTDSPVGSLDKADNVLFSKIGELEKRNGYSNLLPNLLNKVKPYPYPTNTSNYRQFNFLNHSNSLIYEKINKLKNDLLFLGNSGEGETLESTGIKKELHNENGYVANSDVLAVDLNVSPVLGNNRNLANLKPVSDDSGQYYQQGITIKRVVPTAKGYEEIQVHMSAQDTLDGTYALLSFFKEGKHIVDKSLKLGEKNESVYHIKMSYISTSNEYVQQIMIFYNHLKEDGADKVLSTFCKSINFTNGPSGTETNWGGFSVVDNTIREIRSSSLDFSKIINRSYFAFDKEDYQINRTSNTFIFLMNILDGSNLKAVIRRFSYSPLMVQTQVSTLDINHLGNPCAIGNAIAIKQTKTDYGPTTLPTRDEVVQRNFSILHNVIADRAISNTDEGKEGEAPLFHKRYYINWTQPTTITLSYVAGNIFDGLPILNCAIGYNEFGYSHAFTKKADGTDIYTNNNDEIFAYISVKNDPPSGESLDTWASYYTNTSIIVKKIILPTATGSVSVEQVGEIKNSIMASTPISHSYNDYFLTLHNSITNPFYTVYCLDKRLLSPEYLVQSQTPKDVYEDFLKPISKIFYENTSGFTIPSYDTTGGRWTSPVVLKKCLDMDTTHYKYQYRALANYSWLPNLTIINDDYEFRNKLSTNEANNTPFNAVDFDPVRRQVKLVGAIAYRDTFKKDLNQFDPNLLQTPQEFNNFNTNLRYSLRDYTHKLSTQSLEINLNSHNRFNGVEINDVIYFPGGIVSYYDGKKLNQSGFIQPPELLTGFFGTNSNQYLVDEVRVSPDSDIKIQITQAQADALKGVKAVRFYASAGNLPGGVVEDTALTASAGVGKYSIEYKYSLVNLTSSTKYLLLIDPATNTAITITSDSGVDEPNCRILFAPFQSFGTEKDKLVQFSAIYEHIDEAGKITRSQPSLPIYFRTTSPLNSNMRLYVNNFTFNEKTGKVKLKIFRTLADGPAVFYKTYEEILIKDNLPLHGVVIDIDQDKLQTQEYLYTTGGILENISAISSSALAVKGNRIYAVDGENKKKVLYSKKTVDGEAVEFNDVQYVMVDEDNEDILNICAVDDNIVVFKESSIWTFSGDGVNERGQGYGINKPVKIFNNIGLDKNNTNAVFVCKAGILFKTPKGLYLIPKGFGGVQPIGMFIDEYLKGIKLDTRLDLTVEKNYYVYNMTEDILKNSVHISTDLGVFTFNLEQNVWTRTFHLPDYFYNNANEWSPRPTWPNLTATSTNNNITPLTRMYKNSNPISAFYHKDKMILLSNIMRVRDAIYLATGTGTEQNWTTRKIYTNLTLTEFDDRLSNGKQSPNTVMSKNLDYYYSGEQLILSWTFGSFPETDISTPSIKLVLNNKINKVASKFETNFISLGQIQHYGRLWKILFVGKRNANQSVINPASGTLKYKTTIQYDYEDKNVPTEIMEYVQEITLASDTNKLYQFKVNVGKQKCQSFKIIFEEIVDNTSSASLESSWSLNGIDIEFGIKNKTPIGASGRAKRPS